MAMALTEEQRAKLNAKAQQKKSGFSQNDYDEYQEFLRFKEMKQQGFSPTSSSIVEEHKAQYTLRDVPFIILALAIPVMIWSDMMNIGCVFIGLTLVVVICYAFELYGMARKGMGCWIYWGLLFLPVYVFLRISHTTKRYWPSVVMCIGIALSLMIGFGWNSIGQVANNSFKAGISSSKANTMSIDEFKASCKEYDYKDILRNPSNYAGKYMKITVGISNELNNMDGYWSALSSTAIGWYGDQYVIHYGLDTKILPDDVVTIYGICEGTMDVVSVLGVRIEVPLIEARAVDFLTDAEADKFVKDAYNKYLGDVLGDLYDTDVNSNASVSQTNGLSNVEKQVINENTFISGMSAHVIATPDFDFDYEYNGGVLNLTGEAGSQLISVIVNSTAVENNEKISVALGQHTYIFTGSFDAETTDYAWVLNIYEKMDATQNEPFSLIYLMIRNPDGSLSKYEIQNNTDTDATLKKVVNFYKQNMEQLDADGAFDD